MSAYVATTGVLASDPWFILITLASTGLCLWAFVLLRRRRS